MITAETFATAVESLIGTPVIHHGRSRNGVDCVGLELVALRELGIVVEDTTVYGMWPSESKLTSAMEKHCRLLARAKLPRGAILQVYKGRGARHLAVVSGETDGRIVIVHAWGKFVSKNYLMDPVKCAWAPNGVEF